MKIIIEKFANKIFSNALFFSLITILVLWHICTLIYSPLVWFDEVFMASMTNSLLNGNGFALEIAKGEQVLIYGPIYFLLTAFSFLIGGVNAFSFRIVNLIFAFLTVYTLYKIMGKLRINKVIKRLIVFMFLTDVIFVQNSHSGRMEFVAVFFTLLCLYYYLKDKLTTIDYCFIALFASLSFLTTPRVAVILFPIIVFVLIRLIKELKWITLVLFLSIPTIFYSTWILFSYGSINAWIDYYTISASPSTQSNLDRFLGISFFIPKYQYPLIVGAFIVIIRKIRNKEYKITLLLLIPIVTYYLLVKTTSATYTAFILAFLYSFLALGFKDITNSSRLSINSYYIIIGTIFIVNIGIFVFKGATVISTIEGRNPKSLNEWIAKNVKMNSDVVGSECYFYGCMANSCSLGLLYPDCYFSDKIKPQYLLISKTALNDIRIAEGFATLKNSFNLEYIDSYTPENKDDFFIEMAAKMGITFDNSYAGDLYYITTVSLKETE